MQAATAAVHLLAKLTKLDTLDGHMLMDLFYDFVNFFYDLSEFYYDLVNFYYDPSEFHYDL